MTIQKTQKGQYFVRSKRSGRKYRLGFAISMKVIQYVAFLVAVLAVFAFFGEPQAEDFGTFAMQMATKTIGSILTFAISAPVAYRISKSF